MITEAAIAALLTLAGFALVPDTDRGVPRAARLALSLPMGAALFLLVCLVLLTTTGTVRPGLALTLTSVLGLGWALFLGFPDRLELPLLAWAGGAVMLAVTTVVVARTWHLTRLTPDSLRYLLGSNDLVDPEAVLAFNRADLSTRMIGLPSLHTLADLTDRRYLTSIGPLFGVFGAGLVGQLMWWLAGESETRRRTLFVTASALAFLGASNRLVYDVFYVNTHIEMAIYLLIAIAGAWLAVVRRLDGWAFPAGLAVAATVLLRPEAPLMVAVILVVVAAAQASNRVRVAVALPPLLTMVVWYGVILWQYANGGDEVSLTSPVFGSLAAVSVAAIAAMIGGVRRARPLFRRLDLLGLIGLAAVAGYFATTRPDVLTESIEATFSNLTRDGFWLFTWMAAIGLLLVALVVQRIEGGRMWIIPIVAFGLLYWILPALREGPWRVGAGDSGNRILAHILPTVVVFLVLASLRPSREPVPGPARAVEVTP